MKRTLTILAIALFAAFVAKAQGSLNVAKVFDGRFRDRKEATEVLLKGKEIKSYGLTLFRSLTRVLPDKEAQQVEAWVTADGASATDKETGRKGSRLYYGFYKLKPSGGQNRYIFYRNNALQPGKSGKLTVIYMEGTATITELKRNFGM